MNTRSETLATKRTSVVRRSPTAVKMGHWLVSPGNTGIGQFRGWARVVFYYKCSQIRRLRVLIRLASWPLLAVLDAHRSVRQFGRDLENEANVSRRRQLAQLWWLRARHGLRANAYIDFQLYRPERRPRATRYVQEWEFVMVSRFINRVHRSKSDVAMLSDKVLFSAWCRKHSLPTPETLVEFRDGVVANSVLTDGAVPPCNLFSKPADSMGGHGAARWVYDGAGGYIGVDGRRREGSELLEELAIMSKTLRRKVGDRTHRIILQKSLQNHQTLRPLVPGAVATVRLVTYRWPERSPEVLTAVYKIPVGNMSADNFRYGGLLAPVDSATGRLGGAVHRRSGILTPIERHPDTGVSIEGYQLPYWSEAVQMALRAHSIVRRIPSLGWDVALTDDGPVLVEANTTMSPSMVQMASGVPLGDTGFVDCMNAYARGCFGL
jgi:hypothetical protein